MFVSRGRGHVAATTPWGGFYVTTVALGCYCGCCRRVDAMQAGRLIVICMLLRRGAMI
jgi:hypothetical protein